MRWARTIANLFWLWTLVGTVWAWFVPEHFTWFLGNVPGTGIRLTAVGLGVIMLGMGVTLTFADFRAVLAMPRPVAVGVVAQFVLMPFLGWAVASAFGLPDDLKLGLILVSCCPGGTASNVVAYLARANVALSVLMTMCATLLAILLTPFLTKAYASAILEVDAFKMVVTMVTIVLVPVVAGILLNQFAGSKLRLVREISPLVSIAVIVLIVGGIVGKSKATILANVGPLLVAVLILHVGGFLFGYFWARLFRLRERECRTVSIEVGMQNSGLGAELARTHFAAMAGAAATCAISALYHCLLGSLLASFWRSRDPAARSVTGRSRRVGKE